MAKKKLVLINPRGKFRMGFVIDKESRYPPLGLAIIASLTPDEWEVKLLDENFTDFEYEDADLVGITSFTSTITRAYEIAEIYKKVNTPVILGGIHASMVPNEAEKFSDSVVIGEVESVWDTILSDFEKGTLKKRYQGELISLDKIPIARHDLFHEDYHYDSIQTTRGCPMRCDFCSVHVFNGRSYRMRPVKDVLDELELIKSKRIIFVDDNIVGYNTKARDHAKAIFRGMIERNMNKSFFCQASINIGDDEELIELAAQAGCRMVFIGIESESIEALEKMNKRSNLKMGVDNYEKVFDKIRKHGISVLAAFIFGLETDKPVDLEKRMDYILNANIDAMQTSILTPLPGTLLYDQLAKENRIIANNYPEDWEKYWGGETLFEPKNMSAEYLEEFKFKMVEKVYGYKRLLTMFMTTLKKTKNKESSVWAFSSNTHYNNMIYQNDESKQIKVDKMIKSIKG